VHLKGNKNTYHLNSYYHIIVKISHLMLCCLLEYASRKTVKLSFVSFWIPQTRSFNMTPPCGREHLKSFYVLPKLKQTFKM